MAIIRKEIPQIIRHLLPIQKDFREKSASCNAGKSMKLSRSFSRKFASLRLRINHGDVPRGRAIRKPRWNPSGRSVSLVKRRA